MIKSDGLGQPVGSCCALCCAPYAAPPVLRSLLPRHLLRPMLPVLLPVLLLPCRFAAGALLPPQHGRPPPPQTAPRHSQQPLGTWAPAARVAVTTRPVERHRRHCGRLCSCCW